MKKVTYIYIVAMLFIGMAGYLAFAADVQINNNANVLVQQNKVTHGIVNGGILGVIQFERSLEADAHMTPELLKSSGWVRTATHYQISGALKECLIGVDSEPAQKIFSDGSFKIKIPLGNHILRIYDQEGNEIDNREVSLDEQCTEEMMRVVIVHDLKDHSCCGLNAEPIEESEDLPDATLDENSEKSYAARRPTPTPRAPTCLDYNASGGNCVNYSSGAMRAWNFVGSDCQFAMIPLAHCWSEVMPGSAGCNHNGHNCSPFIGHSEKKHCH